ncbi:hypothetical protein CL622_07420 [archaeon]|nr:hypothetical protein [archaeon]
MLVKDAVSRIRFQTNTNDDNTGRNLNTLFSNKNLIAQFMICLDQYASYTQGIEDIFSYPLGLDVRSISAPVYAISSQAYKNIFIWRGGRRYQINIRPMNYTHTRFPYQGYSGIPQFISIWKNEIYFYPDSSTSYETTALSLLLSSSDTTISVTSTEGFPSQNGRISIGTEKILYQSKSSTQFLNCTRGVEDTTAIEHANSTEVKENNLMVFYSRLEKPIFVDDDDIISTDDLNRELNIPTEHMIGIIDLTTYMLLVKVDAQRAVPYKMDSKVFLEQAKEDIQWGKSNITSGLYISDAFDWETNNVGATM